MGSRLPVLAVVFVAVAVCADPVEFFETRVRPLLAEKCYACHSARTVVSSGLHLDSRDGARRGGNRGPAVVPGQPDLSLMLRAISYTDPDLRMPPTGKLTDQQIADLTEWIRLGASDPREEAAAAPAPGDVLARAKRHWSFQPFRAYPAPRVRDSRWPANWIDRFVLAKLESKSQRPAPAADKRSLIRRLTFDLTGLPPSPEEVQAFLDDNSSQAYERLVDRLLASPHYGERWARHWLDLARYAETDGHEFDREKPNAWRYRDYVIRAFNADVPYDQFVREHIAGDLLNNKRLEPGGAYWDSPLGTGFFGLGEERNAADDLAEVRAEKTDNQIDALGKTFLGLTLGCARCHDHKFDPIPTRDYYALAGVLHSKQVIQACLDSPARILEINRFLDEIQTQGPEPPQKPLELRPGDVLVADFSRGTPEGWRIEGPAFARPFRSGAPPELTGFVYSRTFRADHRYLHVLLAGSGDSTSPRQPGQLRVSLVGDGRDIGVTPDPSGDFKWKTAGLGKMQGEMVSVEIADRSSKGTLVVDKILLSNSREPPGGTGFKMPGPSGPVQGGPSGPVQGGPSGPVQGGPPGPHKPPLPIPESSYGMVSVEDTPQNQRVYIAGNHMNRGEEVPRGFLRALGGGVYIQGSGRQELAAAMASASNPLTARVMANRIWQHHFGEGLVRTVDNFGLMGERPSNPELLDTLAARFVESGWSVKKLHREIVLSATYRAGRAPLRLEAEAIRDAILAVSGSLDRTVYGPSVPPFISPYQDGRGKPPTGPLDGNGRRSIYLGVRRNFLPPMFVAFDYPMTVMTVGRRGVSTVASQALILMNNEFVAAEAARWASRIEKVEATPRERVERMFLAAYGRPAEPGEIDRALTFLATRELRDLAHAVFNSKEFVFIR